jgi:hypothetical protein
MEPKRLLGRILLDNPSEPIPCVAWDFSFGGGAKLAVPHPETLPEPFWVILGRNRYRCRIVWRDERFIGVKFTDFIPNGDRREKDRRAPRLFARPR